ncbi:glycosyltransferase [Thalassotalea euphylliae]|uniref:Glycosyltransferase n=1 Tax=Thalassotalea euphylliae TaxID=1655234 RepID=A0A3E0TSQ0_9GAMM|nr:glycosyltransferase family 2 protein [Thalassotalea euphylliae]REL26955.1 glycosyltransferase [Thalassotalea euphylliae]
MNIVDIELAKENMAGQFNTTLSIVVPVYNEQEVLPLFHHELSTELARLPNEQVEIIYVNDGSTDNSWQIMQTLSTQTAHIECLNLSRNFGKEAALTAGLDHACGECVVILDADLQDPPCLLPQMLAAWRQGADVVNMKRGIRHDESKIKLFCASTYYWLLDHLSDVPIERDVGDFRLLSRRMVDHIKQLPERNRYMKGIMSWPGFKQTTITFDRPGRAAGETKWSFLELVRLGLSGITAFSVRPLKMASWLGGAISLVAFFYGLWVMFKTLVFGEAVAGYPTIVLIQLFLGGIQLLTIGILGEYVGRVFIESKKRPIYLLMDVESSAQAIPSEMQQHG